MKKTLSITIGQQSFVIEEDAYNQLVAYLEEIKNHCGEGATAEEVLADIESSMAEKLKSSLKPYQEVITEKEVSELISVMGTSEDFDREVGSASDQDKENNQTKRKLYRDTDNAIIAGVGSGLGNYFDIDPIIFRLLFCALVFAGGGGFIAYIILWIAMPEAKTAQQKLEMQGQAPTVSAFKNLAETGKKIQKNWKKRWESFSVGKKIISLPILILQGLFNVLKKIWTYLWPAIKFSFGLLLTLLSLMFLGAIGVGFMTLLLYGNSPYQISYIPISEIASMMPLRILIASGFLSLGIPAILTTIGGLSILRKKSLINFTALITLVGIWMMAGIIFCALCVRYLPDLKHKYDTYPPLQMIEQEISVDNIKLNKIKTIKASGNFVIVSSDSTSTKPYLKGRQIDLDTVEWKYENNTLALEQKEKTIDPSLCFDCHTQSITLMIGSSSDQEIITENGASIYQIDDTNDDVDQEEYEEDVVIEE